MMTLRTGLMVWAVIGPLVAGGLMWGREQLMVNGAISNTIQAERVVCNDRVAEIERKHNARVTADVEEALAQARAVLPLPTEMVARQQICDASRGCRSRRVQ